MWIWFNNEGILKKSLIHGNAARVGTTDFQIFAYFDEINIEDTYTEATIRLEKPDLEHTEYPTLYMSRKTKKYVRLESDGDSDFVNNEYYKGYLFDFSEFEAGNDTLIRLLDTPGLWKATITLIDSSNVHNVTGIVTFNVQGSVSRADDDLTVLDDDDIIDNITYKLGEKVSRDSLKYVRELDDFTDNIADKNPLDFPIDSYVFDAVNSKLYQIIAIPDEDVPGSEFEYEEIELDYYTKSEVDNRLDTKMPLLTFENDTFTLNDIMSALSNTEKGGCFIRLGADDNYITYLLSYNKVGAPLGIPLYEVWIINETSQIVCDYYGSSANSFSFMLVSKPPYTYTYNFEITNINIKMVTLLYSNYISTESNNNGVAFVRINWASPTTYNGYYMISKKDATGGTSVEIERMGTADRWVIPYIAIGSTITLYEVLSSNTYKADYLTNADAYTKTQVNNLLDEKVNKLGTGSSSRVYTVSVDGTQGSVGYNITPVPYFIVQRDTNGQIFVKDTPTEYFHATSKKYVDDNIQTVMEVAEGKTNSYVLDVTMTIAKAKEQLSLPQFSSYKFYVWNVSTHIWEDKTTELLAGDYDDATVVNADFNTSNDILTTYNIIIGVYGDSNDFYMGASYYGPNSFLKTGDVIYVYQTNVPDRWICIGGGAPAYFYPLESKTDLSNYYTKAETDTLLGNKADKVGPLPEYTVSSNDNVLDFIVNNNLNYKPIIIKTDNQASYIGEFRMAGNQTSFVFEFECLSDESRFTSLPNYVDMTNQTFDDLFGDDTYKQNYATTNELANKADKVGPLPKYTVFANDNILDFINEHNIVIGTPIVIYDHNTSSILIGSFSHNGPLSTTYDFEFENLNNAARYKGSIVDLTNMVFADIFASLTYLQNYELANNKVTSLSSSSTDTQYPSAKVVWDNLQNVREVAEGKTNSYVVDTRITTISSLKNQGVYFEVWNTTTKEWEDKSTELNNGDYDSLTVTNSDFISTLDYISIRAENNECLLLGKYIGGGTHLCMLNGYPAMYDVFKLGDIIYVTDNDVPDRWMSSPQHRIGWSALDAKTDLSNYYTKTETNTLLNAKQDIISETNKISYQYIDGLTITDVQIDE